MNKKFSSIEKIIEELAENHVDIKHSADSKKFFTEEAELSSNNRPKKFLYLIPPSSKFNGTPDSVSQDYDTELWICFASSNDNVAIKKAKDDAEEIARDFLSALLLKARFRKGNPPEIDRFDLNKVGIDFIGPVFQTYYGASLTIPAGISLNLTVNPAKWLKSFEN